MQQTIKTITKHVLGTLLTVSISFTALADNSSVIPKSETEIPALRITTKPLSELEFVTEYSAPATVVSLNDSSISAEVQGRALKIKAEVGDKIRKGALLVELDCRNYINNKQQAIAALRLSKTQRDFARKQFTRNQRLLQRGVLPRESFDKSESDLSTSLADLALKQTSIDSAELAISKCKIYAPFSGQVTAKNVQQGQLITPGTSLVQLLQTDKLEVEAELSPNELSTARNSPKLLFTTNSVSQTVTIRSVIQQLDSASNTLRVRLSLRSNDEIITGLNGRLKWQDGSRKVPSEYLVSRNGALGVMLAIEGKAKFHPIPSAREGQPATVSLLSNTQVIIVNRYSAKDGQAVKVD